MKNVKLMNKSKDLVHSLYNIPLINRLVNYIYFTAYTQKLTFSSHEEDIIRELSNIGKYAGLNGVYRSDYGDKSQF